ncbi:MAG: hypothetical protein AAGC88_14465 [Bacteroidota bacterium]
MTPENNEHDQIKEILQENQKLLAENNRLLKKIHRNAMWTFWVRIVWFVFIIGLPFVLYFYIIEPYFAALGSSFEVFQAGLQEIPGWKQFYGTIQGETIPDTE